MALYTFRLPNIEIHFSEISLPIWSWFDIVCEVIKHKIWKVDVEEKLHFQHFEYLLRANPHLFKVIYLLILLEWSNIWWFFQFLRDEPTVYTPLREKTLASLAGHPQYWSGSWWKTWPLVFLVNLTIPVGSSLSLLSSIANFLSWHLDCLT